MLVLQHPRERRKAIGTARIAALCLPAAEIVVGVELGRHPAVRAALADTDCPPVLLYPPDAGDAVCSELPGGPFRLIVLDGTWHHARSLLRSNPWLQRLPRYGLAPSQPSNYRIRREPRQDCLSTIEALALTLGAIEGAPGRFEAMLNPFRAMVDTQIAYATRLGTPRRRAHPRSPRAARSRLPGELLEPRLVCVSVEANAWPYDPLAASPRQPHEAIHLCAVRLASGERFEQVIAPRLPLAQATLRHTRLSLDEVQAGGSLAALRHAWSEFLDARDVLCSWGVYGPRLLVRDGIQLPARWLDLRKVAGDHLKARPGSCEQLTRRFGLAHPTQGRGRGGERLGLLVALAQWLAREASGQPTGNA